MRAGFHLLRRSPKVKDVFEGCAKSDIVVRPAENSDLVHKVSAVPDYYVPQFISCFLESVDYVNVDLHSMVLPPEVRYIDYTVSLWSHQRKNPCVDFSESLRVRRWVHRSKIHRIVRVLLNCKIMFIVSEVSSYALVLSSSIQHVRIRRRGDGQ